MSRARALVDRTFSAGRPAADVPAAALLAGALLGGLAAIEVVASDTGQGTATSLLLGLCATAPVVLAGSHVRTAAVVVTAATALTVASGERPTAAGLLAQLAVLFLLARRPSHRLSLLLLLPFVGNAADPAAGQQGRPSAIALLAVLTVATGAGLADRLRADARDRGASDRAAADSVLAHAARGERARIARELHDVVAHHISMIAVQAETARLTTPGMPAEGARRLQAIGDTARCALTEMRRLLGVLREDAEVVPTRAPQPSLEQLNELIDEARDSAGGGVRLIVRGRVVPLDPGVQLTAYRIAQEGLTNARRHAPGAAVDVELDYEPDALLLRVRDNGPGPPAAIGSGGHGLLGMGERAAMVGGQLSTGPGPYCGFLVEATLPAPGVAG